MARDIDLPDRTMTFSLDVAVLCRHFPNTQEGRHVRGQLFRAASGLAANYRAACRGRSTPEFVAKLGTAIEEGDEADFWMEFGVRSGLLKAGLEKKLRKEADELVRILVTSRATAREKMEEKAKRQSTTIGVALVLIGLAIQYAVYSILQ